MGVIRVLNENVANQIAAGEVVERPESVVKELVENALDAGASRILVEIVGGGADLLEVADDGCGMERDDAVLALERHATSKIRGAEDLRSITTFGFRGEALPSIASVSRLTLTTATGATPGGTRVVVHTGTIVQVEPAPHPRGTTVRVEALFQNAPARRKFLRSAATESARILDRVEVIAIAHPAIAFRLSSRGKEIASWPPASSAIERVSQILGSDQAARLLTVRQEVAGTRLDGVVSSPELNRSSPRDLRLYVNGRPVRDRRVQHAIQASYATLLPRGRYPVAYLFLTVPPGEVDVNVHPAKGEVRFLRPGSIHDLVHATLLDALRVARPFYVLSQAPRSVAEPAAAFVAGGGDAGRSGPEGGRSMPSLIPGEPRSAPSTTAPTGRAPAIPLLLEPAALSPLAQYRESYILASAPDGLVIVDQHAAHERVLYEAFMGSPGNRSVERQRLLFPAVLEVTPSQYQAYLESAGSLDALGFGIESFGESTLKIAEIPAILSGVALERLMRDLLDEMLEWRRAEGLEGLRHRIVSTAACHAAVTANQALGGAEMARIVADLLRTASPMTCPHGRPVLLRLGLDYLEKEFKRR
jgi:DNA mismatch repair protein MutL